MTKTPGEGLCAAFWDSFSALLEIEQRKGALVRFDLVAPEVSEI